MVSFDAQGSADTQGFDRWLERLQNRFSEPEQAIRRFSAPSHLLSREALMAIKESFNRLGHALVKKDLHALPAVSKAS